MSDMISGLAGQIFQKLADNPGAKPQMTPQGGRSFESYMQQQNGQTAAGGGGEQPTKVEPKPVTGAGLQETLDQLGKDLAQKYPTKPGANSDFSKLIPELTNQKSRFGLMRDAYSKMGETSKVTSDLSGRFVQVESEYKAVEEIMNSNKNLSTGELLALQARLYQVGQHIEVMSKVVDQMAGGIKTVLNTNV